MGESAQFNFTPKKIVRNFADLGEFPPNQQIFDWTLDEIRSNRKKFAHKYKGETKLRGFARFWANKNYCVPISDELSQN
jgi:hypothetical protein